MPYKNPEDREDYPAYDRSPARKKARAARNKARRIMMDKGLVKKGDGKDVDHKVPISRGGKTTLSNLRVQSASDNRTFRRDEDRKPLPDRGKKK